MTDTKDISIQNAKFKEMKGKPISINKNKNIFIPIYKKKNGNPILFNYSFKKKLLSIKGDIGAKNIIKKNFTKKLVNILDEVDNKICICNYTFDINYFNLSFKYFFMNTSSAVEPFFNPK